MKPTASVLFRIEPRERWAAFEGGLAALGYNVQRHPLDVPHENDVLVLWNRLPLHEHFAERYEKVGASVLIAENGWIGEDTYALCARYHNGAGSWRVGDESRWPSFGIELKPWRKTGDHILVIPQRGMGTVGIAMPRTWRADTVEALQKRTKREIRVRCPSKRNTPLEPEFENCHAVVTWASGAGVKAIVAGVPVFYEMRDWIGATAASPLCTDLEDPFLGDRKPMLHTLSWAQWKAEEIITGEPFKCVLR